MNSRPHTDHDPFEHLATKEALTAVATRLEATLPHLATKADVKDASNRFITLLIVTLLASFLTFFGLHASMLDRLAKVEQQVYSSQRELQAEIHILSREQRELASELRQLSSEVRDAVRSSDERLRRLEEPRPAPKGRSRD